MNPTTTTAPTPIIERPHISWATYEYMRLKIAELEATNAQLQADVDHWEHQANHWYMKANYTDLGRVANLGWSRETHQDSPRGT